MLSLQKSYLLESSRRESSHGGALLEGIIYIVVYMWCPGQLELVPLEDNVSPTEYCKLPCAVTFENVFEQ